MSSFSGRSGKWSVCCGNTRIQKGNASTLNLQTKFQHRHSVMIQRRVASDLYGESLETIDCTYSIFLTSRNLKTDFMWLDTVLHSTRVVYFHLYRDQNNIHDARRWCLSVCSDSELRNHSRLTILRLQVSHWPSKEIATQFYANPLWENIGVSLLVQHTSVYNALPYVKKVNKKKHFYRTSKIENIK